MTDTTTGEREGTGDGGEQTDESGARREGK